MLPTPYYQEDGITIYHGDNCDILCTIEKESVDLIVTSPPYDSLRDYGLHNWDFYGVSWLLTRVLKPGGLLVWIVNDETVEGGESGTSMKQAIHFQNLGLKIHDTMIWNKIGFTATGSLAVRYAPVFEYMFVFSKGRPKTFNPIKDHKNKTTGCISGTVRQVDGNFKPMSNIGKMRSDFGQRFNIWEIPNTDRLEGHPAIFPKQIALDHITSWSNEGDVVLDPFMGSGTTLRAAKDLGSVGVGVEINKPYCEIAVNRLRQSVLNFEIEPAPLGLED